MARCIKCGIEYHAQKDGSIRRMQDGSWKNYCGLNCVSKYLVTKTMQSSSKPSPTKRRPTRAKEWRNAY